jgi:hypothetical protein
MHAPAAEPEALCKKLTALVISVNPIFALMAHDAISAWEERQK